LPHGTPLDECGYILDEFNPAHIRSTRDAIPPSYDMLYEVSPRNNRELALYIMAHRNRDYDRAIGLIRIVIALLLPLDEPDAILSDRERATLLQWRTESERPWQFDLTYLQQH